MALPVPPPAAPLAPGALIAGKYRLLHLVGEGAMGAVWAARNEATSADVAIKLLREPDAEMRRRIHREARVGALLKHRHILDVYDAGETATGDPFLVMQLLQGETLAGLLRRRRRLDAAEACRIAGDIARALAAAHTHKVVHRDLKPANIFLHQEAGEDEPLVKVLDFGVAKDLTSSDSLKTVAGTVIGSLFYMSPEQASAQPDVDHRADIWSLGVVLFEMLTGQRPFQGDAPQVFTALLQGEVPRVSRYLRRLDAGLDELVAGCMRRNREERYGSAAELAKALHRMADALASGAAARGSLASAPDATAVLPGGPPVATAPKEDITRTVPLATPAAATSHPRGGTIRLEDDAGRKISEELEKRLKEASAQAGSASATAAPVTKTAPATAAAAAAPAAAATATATGTAPKRSGRSPAAIAITGVVIVGIGLGAVLYLRRGHAPPASVPAAPVAEVNTAPPADPVPPPPPAQVPTAAAIPAASSTPETPPIATAPTASASASAAPPLSGRLPKQEEDPCKDQSAFALKLCRERQKREAAESAYGSPEKPKDPAGDTYDNPSPPTSRHDTIKDPWD